MRILVKTTLIVLFVLCLSNPFIFASNVEKPKQVLLLFSYNFGMPWQQTAIDGIRSTFASDARIKTVLYAEYTGLIQTSDDLYVRKLQDLYRHKYANRKIDLVVSVGLASSNFMLRHGEEIFPGVPIVFASATTKGLEDIALKPDVTGVIEDVDIKGTLNAALKLQPDTRLIAVISGSSKVDRFWEAKAREVFDRYEGGVKFAYLTGLTMGDLLKKVVDLPEHTIIFYVLTIEDGDGKSFIPRDVVARISAKADAPVYGLWATFLGYGIVGGDLSSSRVMGEKAARLGLAVLQGEKASNIPVIKGANAYMFDWRQLKRWGIKEKNLPGGSIVRYTEISFWERYKWRIIGVAALLVLEGVLILVLAIQVTRRRRAEQALIKAHEQLEQRVEERTCELVQKIKERKKADEARRESEERYRFLVEKSNDIIWTFDLSSMTYTYFSNSAEKVLGYPPEEGLVLTLDDVFFPAMKKQVMSAFGKLLRADSDSTRILMEAEHRYKDGGTVWMEINTLLHRDSVNQPVRFTGVSRDITDRKRAETALIEAHAKLESRVLERTAELSIANEKLAQEIEESRKAGKALQESNERYRTLIESVTDAVVIVDPDGKLTYLNPEYEKISGYPVEELIGRLFTELVPPEDRESTLERFRQGLSGEKTPIAEISILHKDGSQVPVEINSTTLLDAEGKPVGRIAVVRDISKRKSLEAHLLQRQRLESIGILAGGIAHDFDNILSIIMGFTDMAMREVPEKSRARQNLDRALRGIQRAADLVKQITAFSRQSMPTRGPVLVSPIAEDVASLLRASLPETIEIRLDLQTGIGTVYADPTQIHQVLMNLSTNAAHAMREKGGILEVSLAEVEMDAAALAGLPDISPGDYLRMTVSDTGEGMSPDVLDLIFDPYFSTKERGEGTGLGLSVIHGIMKSHGGAITVRSKPRKGTTFHVYLPLLKHRAEPEEQIGVYEPLPGGNERILFVEDEEDMVFLVGQLLESLGYEVITRANGMDVLALFREQPDRFDLVITDMTLPGMTGERLAEQIKKIRHDTPIILCTGFGEDITEERARKMGIGEIILKPLVNIDLTKTIRKVLDNGGMR